MGVTMEDTGLAQVTMNLLDYRVTSMEFVFSKIEEEAARRGVEIVNSELIGLVPLDALLDVAFARLKLEGFSRQRILDLIT
jgi:glutamate formiminotransferase